MFNEREWMYALGRLVVISTVVIGIYAFVAYNFNTSDVLAPKVTVQADTTADKWLADVNAYRAQHKLPALKWNAQLAVAADMQSVYMAGADTVDHGQGLFSKSTPQVRAETAGYRGWTMIAENVAGGFSTWDAVFRGWQKSPGHNANILNPAAREIGIAVVENKGTNYNYFWTMVLGARER